MRYTGGGREERGAAADRIREARMLFAVWLQASCSTSLNIHFLVSKGRANDRATERIGRRAQYKACHVNNTRNTHSIRRNCYCLRATYTISCGIYNSLCSRRIGV